MNRILVYVAHPYGGDIENKKKVEEFINPLKKYETDLQKEQEDQRVGY